MIRAVSMSSAAETVAGGQIAAMVPALFTPGLGAGQAGVETHGVATFS
jgi:hypothetical protein